VISSAATCVRRAENDNGGRNANTRWVGRSGLASYHLFESLNARNDLDQVGE
jgi:hypothetical protein